MKCSKCGYVSFDDLGECKNCGQSFDVEAPEGEENRRSTLQDDLFSMRLDDLESRDKTEIPSPEEEPAPEVPDPRPKVPPAEELPVPAPWEGEGSDDAADASPDNAGAVPQEAEPPGEFEFTLKIPEPARAEERDPPEFDAEEKWIEEGAGFGIRLAAFAIDSLVLCGILALFFIGAALALGGDWTRLTGPGGMSELFVPFYLLGLFLSLSYFTFFVGWQGRTPGKAVLKLEIRRTDGGPMSYTRAFLRWAGYLVSLTAAGLGFLWIFFNDRKRGWHDYLSGTWVRNLRNGG